MIDRRDLDELEPPFKVLHPPTGRVGVLQSITWEDPLGTGLPEEVAYFEGGGKLLVSELLAHYEISGEW